MHKQSIAQSLKLTNELEVVKNPIHIGISYQKMNGIQGKFENHDKQYGLRRRCNGQVIQVPNIQEQDLENPKHDYISQGDARASMVNIKFKFEFGIFFLKFGIFHFGCGKWESQLALPQNTFLYFENSKMDPKNELLGNFYFRVMLSGVDKASRRFEGNF